MTTTKELVVRGLHAKLAEVMAEAGRIPKNGSYKNPGEYGHFKFVQVGDAADSIRTALGERKVSMLPSGVEVIGETEHATKSGGTMTTLMIRTTWTLTDGDTGETTVIQSIGTGADAGDKASPKAQTNAMKYALLMGFLLSTGDDPEQHDSSDRRPIETAPMTRTDDGGLIGTAVKGKAPVDLELRQTPDGAAWGFKLTAGGKGYQALAIGPLAEALSLSGLAEGTRVVVWGEVVMIPWDKAGKPMPPFARIAIERVQSPDWTLPAPAGATEPPEPVEAESESLPWDPAESARIDAEAVA